MKIYIVTCVNEDGWVSIVGAYKTLERAQKAQRADFHNLVGFISDEGYVPVMKRDEFSDVITYGNGHFYKHQIKPAEL